MAHGQWTRADIPALQGRTAVVTGANSGLGFETSKALAGAGATVVMACRNPDKADAAADAVRAAHPRANVNIKLLDLADLDSVQHFADQVHDEYKKLDLLINNAGVMALPERRTRQNFEMQFGTNHLGHFALTGRLFDLLKATPKARVVTLSSLAHRFGKLRFKDPNWERGYSKWPAYGQSKLANLMFALELDRRLRRRGLDIMSLAAHPGFSATHLQLAGPEMTGNRIAGLAMRASNAMFSQSQAAGALPTLYAAVSREVTGGDYVGPSGLFEMQGQPGPAHIARHAKSTDAARRLWELSQTLTGVEFLTGPLADAETPPAGSF